MKASVLKNLRRLTVLAVSLASFGPAIGAQPQSGIEGTWTTKLQSQITIASCPEGFCGYISKIVVPEYVLADDGSQIEQLTQEQLVDMRNKDPLLRDRPILGLQILTLRPGRTARVFDGEIYNPEDGNTYSGFLEVVSNDLIRVNGCVLYNLICRGEDWARVAAQ